MYWRDIIIIFIITLTIGYILGMSISSIVDYRLKEAFINMPQPKVIINQSSPTKVEDELDKPTTNYDIIDNSSYRLMKNPVEKQYIRPPTKVVEEPFTYISQERPVEQINNIGYIEQKKVYPKEQIDKDTLYYENINKKLDKEVYKYGYVPSNYMDYDDQYKIDVVARNITNDINYTKPIEGKIEVPSPSTVPIPIERAKRQIDDGKKWNTKIIDREKRCPNFKQQRVWMNNTNKHEILTPKHGIQIEGPTLPMIYM